MSNRAAGSSSPSPLVVETPPGGFDRAGLQALVKESGLASSLHRMVKAPFGHTVLTLRTLDAVIACGDSGETSESDGGRYRALRARRPHGRL